MFTRAAEVARIVDLLLAGRCVNLVGSRWSGRSEILSRVRQRLLAHGRQVIVVRGIGREITLEAIRLALPPSVRRKLGPRGATVAAVTDGLEPAVLAEPSAFLVDDADQLDSASWVVLESIHKATGSVMLATDLGPAATDPPRRSLMSIARPAVQISLDDLELGAIHDLLEGLIDGPVDPALAARIHAFSGGNPGIGVAVGESAVTTGRIRRVDGVWCGGADLWGEDLNGVFEALLASCPAELRTAVEVLSMVGVTDWRTAQQVVGREALDALESNGLVRVVMTDGRAIVVVHPPGLVDYFRNQPLSIRRLGMLEGMGASLGDARRGALDEQVRRDWGDATVDADTLPLRRAAELPLLAQMFAEDFRLRIATAERRWREHPSAHTCADLLLSGLSGPTDAAVIDEVRARGRDLTVEDSAVEVEVRWLMARSLLARGDPPESARRVMSPSISDGSVVGPALRTMSDALVLEWRAATDDEIDAFRAAASRDGPESMPAAIALVAALIVRDDGAGALAVLDAAAHLVRTPFVEVQVDVLRGLALAADGQFLAATRWATTRLERAIADLDRLGLVGHAYVAALGLVCMSRYREAADIASIPLRMEATATPLLLAPDRAILVLLWTISTLDGRATSADGFAASVERAFPGSGTLPFGDAAWGHAAGLLRDGHRAQAREAFAALAEDLRGRGCELAANVARFLAMMSAVDPADSIDQRLAGGLFAAHLSARQASLRHDARALHVAAERLIALQVLPAAAAYLEEAGRLHREAGDGDGAARARDLAAEITAGAGAALERRANVLTAREAEVVRLIASGLSNAEIAGRLVISIRTVESHINNVRRKSGLTDRGEVGRLATFV